MSDYNIIEGAQVIEFQEVAEEVSDLEYQIKAGNIPLNEITEAKDGLRKMVNFLAEAEGFEGDGYFYTRDALESHIRGLLSNHTPPPDVVHGYWPYNHYHLDVDAALEQRTDDAVIIHVDGEDWYHDTY